MIVMTFIENINTLLAALKPSQYREYWKVWNAKFRDRYKDIFGNKYRIYLDYPSDGTEEIDPEVTTIIQKINEIFMETPYTGGYTIRNAKDYIEGYAYKIGENKKAKIGKLLNSALKHWEKDLNVSNNPKSESIKAFSGLRVDEIKHLLKKFNDRPSYKQMIKSKLVCISRHPYDIAGMSTDRRWTSCMRLEDKEKYIDAGSFSHKIKDDIKEGTLIAYLVEKDDKNINDPLARILIKPYINTNDPNDILLIPEPVIYSDRSSEVYSKFRQVVEDWLETFQNEKSGTYTFNDKLYRDKSPYVINKRAEEEINRVNKNITIDPDSAEKVMHRILHKYPFLFDAKFENLVIMTKLNYSNLIIKSGVWKDGVALYTDFLKDTVVEYGILYNCKVYGKIKNGIFYKGIFYGIFENGVWLEGTFEPEAVWKNGKWKVGNIIIPNKNINMLEKRCTCALNPSITRKIIENSEDDYDFSKKYKKVFFEHFKDSLDFEKYLKTYEVYEKKAEILINRFKKNLF